MKVYKPSVSQQLIWLDQSMSAGSAKYNIGGYAYLEGALNFQLFEKAVRLVLASQEVYGSCFYEEEGVLQVALKDPSSGFAMEVLDMTAHENPAQAAEDWMKIDFSKPFDVTDNYLFSFTLLKISETLHYWYAKIHHLISDGWSFRLLLNQAAEFYDALVNARELPVIIYRYSDYALDDENYYASSAAADDRLFWLNQFRHLPPELLSIHSGTSPARHTADSEVMYLSREQKIQLQQLAEAQKVSLFHIIISLLLIYFSRTRQQPAIVAGVPALNRTKKVYRSTAGVFMNLLALPFEVHPRNTVAELLQQIKQKMASALRHQRYQYGNLVKELPLASRQSLYDIRVSYEDFDFTSDFGGLTTGAIALSNHEEVDKLAIYLRDYNDRGFDVRMVFNTACFDKQSMQDICKSIAYMADILPVYINAPIATMPLQCSETLALIQRMATGAIEERPVSFLQAWESVIATYPDRIAVSVADRMISYAVLNDCVQKIAAVLQQQYCQQHTVIALLLPRSEKMIAAMLSSMMSGLCYIPLDQEYPKERIKYILQDAGCRLLITDHSTLNEIRPISGVEIITLEDILSAKPLPATVASIEISGHSPCYIIYTSGSTGSPKGVVITHGSLADYTDTFRKYFQLTPGDTVLQQATFSFDTSVEEVFPILATGGRLHILEDRRDINMLLQTLAQVPVTILSTTPFVIKVLNDHMLPSSLRLLIGGGDILRPSYLQNILQQGIHVYNTYGPTESTVCATYYRITGNEHIIPIGKPIANRQAYILDEQMHILPLGVEGEIYLGGHGLALGYVNDPVLTSSRFVGSVFQEGKRLYKTGDRGLMRPDGNIIFRGRVDDQLNYRGYRIEAAEIEQVIQRQSCVKDCVVSVTEMNEIPRLVAYIQYRNTDHLSVTEWRKLLHNQVPVHMIPEIWVAVDQIPLLMNGKVNRKALPPLHAGMFEENKQEDPRPQTNRELEICKIWKEVLQLPAIDTGLSFFEAGGHSLHMVQLLNRYRRSFNVQLSIQELFTHTTVTEHVQLVESHTAAQYIPIVQIPESVDYAVSDGQRRLWVLSQFEESSRAYHLSGKMMLEGHYDAACFEQAIRKVIQRHEILRTVIRQHSDGELRQVVLPFSEKLIELHYKEMEGCLEAEVSLYVRQCADILFDLSEGPLLRVGLLRLGERQYLFHFTMHHIISDGWSMELLREEVMQYYKAIVNREVLEWTFPSIQYKDYAAWQQQQVHSEIFRQHRDYWLQQFSEEWPLLSLPGGTTRPSVMTHNGSSLAVELNASLTGALRKICRAHNCTLFMGLLSLLKILLYRYTGHSDIIVGTAVAGRDHAELEGQIGFYVNTLPLRTRLQGSSDFCSLLQQVRETVMMAYTHQQYPFDRLVEELALDRDMSRSPLFDIVMVLQNQQQGHISRDRIEQGNVIELGPCLVKYDWYLSFEEQGDHLYLYTEFNNDIYDKETIKRALLHAQVLLDAIISEPQCSIDSLAYLTINERSELLEAYAGEEAGYPAEMTIVDLFKEQTQARGSHAAVVCDGNSISYRELDERSDVLSKQLRSYGVKADDLVLLVMERSLELIVGIMGILKAGGAYVPIDPEYPMDRIRYIISNTQAGIVVTDSSSLAKVNCYEGIKIVNIEEPEEGMPEDHEKARKVRAKDLAYVIYTSGSTGKPKGVMIEHRQVVRLFKTDKPLFDFGHDDVWTMFHSYCFDFSVWEIFGALLHGGKLVIVSREMTRDVSEYGNLLVREGVTVLNQTPQLFYMLSEELRKLDCEVSVRYVIFGGEALDPVRLRWWHKRYEKCRLINMYGITETTVHVTYKEIQEEDIDKGISNIGRPIPTLFCYVLDERGKPAGKGIMGELYVGGAGVGRGYLNLEEMTGERFLLNPWRSEERMYRTGDMVRWLENGELEYLGRGDDQVKIRGYRIELGEIEHTLLQMPSIQAAVVVAMDDHENGRKLIAYVVSTVLQNASQLKQQLLLQLPAYMVPAHIIQLEALPLTVNGKINRRALPSPDKEIMAADNTDGLPQNETEELMLMIYKRILKRERISRKDNFFVLGGNSLLIIRLCNEIRVIFHISIQIKELYKAVTIEEVAEIIDAVKWLKQGTVINNNQANFQLKL